MNTQLQTSASVTESYTSLAKPLVLVVEDEAAIATMLRYNLEKFGFRVDEAADGQDFAHGYGVKPEDRFGRAKPEGNAAQTLHQAFAILVRGGHLPQPPAPGYHPTSLQKYSRRFPEVYPRFPRAWVQ